MRFQVATRTKENLNTPKFTPRWRGPVTPPHAPRSVWGWPGFGVRKNGARDGAGQGWEWQPPAWNFLNNGVLGLNKKTNK